VQFTTEMTRRDKILFCTAAQNISIGNKKHVTNTVSKDYARPQRVKVKPEEFR
jgi:hypothetical protein